MDTHTHTRILNSLYTTHTDQPKNTAPCACDCYILYADTKLQPLATRDTDRDRHVYTRVTCCCFPDCAFHVFMQLQGGYAAQLPHFPDV